MRNKSNCIALLAGVVLLGSVAGASLAQTPPKPHKPSLMSRMIHKVMHPFGGGKTAVKPAAKPAGKPAVATKPAAGLIIANKNTHVYHLPGDKGALPDPKNTVTFKTEADAAKAGYHKAGVKPATAVSHTKMASPKPGVKPVSSH